MKKVENYYQKGSVVSKYDKKRFTSIGGEFIDSNEKEIVKRLINSENNIERVLDLGAGTGRFSFLLAKEGYDVTSFDQSDEMLKIIDEKSKEENLNISLVRGDAFKLPFEDDTFDACVSIRVLWHFENPEDLIAEMRRVTNKDGVMIFDLLNKKSLIYPITPIANRFVYTDLIKIDDMRAMLESKNVKIIDEEKYFVLPYFFYRYSPNFLTKYLIKTENKLQKTKKDYSSVVYFKVRK